MTPRTEVGGFDVIAVGELNPDLILSGIGADAPMLGVEQEVERCQLTLGSSTAIAAVLMSRLGLRVAMAARVGDDEHGRFCRLALEADAVDTTAIITDPVHSTGLTVSLTYPADRLLMTCAGAMARFTAADVDISLLERTRHLHSASFFLQRSLRRGLAGLFAHARRSGVTTSLDTGWDPQGGWLDDDLRATLARTNTLFPNAAELRHLSGADDVETGAARLLDCGVEEVVVKLGESGAAYFSHTEHVAIDGHAVEVIDTTGAGDAFDAGYVTGRLLNWPIPQRLRFANACGALTAAAIGGTGGFRDKAMVDALAAAGR